jgi:chorismate mutase/prephenate dehydratase
MNLDELRKKIDEIDLQILSLLNERTRIVIEIGKSKESKGLSRYHPDREIEVYRNLIKRNKGPFPNKALKAVYREIMSASLAKEGSLRVAYLGPEATFTHLAACQKFGSSAEYIGAKKISDIFVEVEKGRADFGVVPIENSTEGAITHTLDMFITSNLRICSEIYLEISHNLLANCKMEEIERIYSHSQAFAQSRSWLEENLPVAKCIEVSSTGEAARRAAGEKGAAAIGTELAATLYGLKILRRRIEDQEENLTRFLIIGNEISAPTGNDKTSILFSIKDRVGALYSILAPFALHNINLTKIESRPSRQKAFEYVFFLDLQGHIEDPKVRSALQEVERQCVFLKVLGSYPRGDIENG